MIDPKRVWDAVSKLKSRGPKIPRWHLCPYCKRKFWNMKPDCECTEPDIFDRHKMENWL